MPVCEASRAHELQGEEKPKLKSKHKDNEKSKKKKEKKRKRKHESSEAKEAAKKSSKKSKQSISPRKNRAAISLDNARMAPEAAAFPY
ncbi:g4889 [Coccomyxa viridis]|uniref:G4889 protein n=1 Tax=Coccomyxa viridis TaxID=1274662 RepID=A0ABP1FUC2_9CHLO